MALAERTVLSDPGQTIMRAMGRSPQCPNCGRLVRGMEEPRQEGEHWYCSPSCYLQRSASVGRGGRGRPRRRWLRRLGWTTGIIVGLLVGLGVLGAFIEPPPSDAEQAPALVEPPRSKAKQAEERPSAKTQTKPVPRAKKKKSPPVAHVVVTNVGFSKDPISDTGSIIEYGVVLANRSRTLEARNVTVTVRGVDVQGRSSVTDQMLVTAIPAGGSFVVAGVMVPSVSFAIGKLRAAVRVGATTAQSLRLPVVMNVGLDTSGGQLLEVSGRLRNPSSKPLSPDASMFAVFLDRKGRIVGSTFDSPGAAVSPGATVSFNLEGIVNDPAAHPVTALVSVDPCSQFGCFPP
jgi:hypothetical protein